MSIFIMNGKSFIKDFIKDKKPKEILQTQYVIISSTIRKNGKHSNVISPSDLYPKPRILADFMRTGDDDNFKDEYIEQLKDNKPLLAVLIKGVIEEDYTIVFLCSNKERKYKYLKYLSKFITKEFGYPVTEYGKGKPKTLTTKEKAKILVVVENIISTAEKAKKKKELETQTGRHKLLKKMSKSDMKKKLKKMNLYYSGMDKSEMKESLELFFVNE